MRRPPVAGSPGWTWLPLVPDRRAERCEDLTDPRFGFDQGLLEIGELVRLGGQGIRIMAARRATSAWRTPAGARLGWKFSCTARRSTACSRW